MSKKMQFREVAVESDTKPRASVSFRPGLNVIAGASDTGKTYVYQLLDFMLGSSSSPKAVPEATGYSRVQSEATTFADSPFSLFRQLFGGEFQLFRVPISRIGPKDIGILIYEASYRGDEENISDVLLDVMDVDRIKLRRGNDNSTQKLSIRNLVRMAMVNEERIISARSPVFSDDRNLAVLDRSLFEFMLTGRGADGLEVAPNPKIRRADWSARVAVFDDLIEQTETDIQNKTTQIRIPQANLDEIESQIVTLSTSVTVGDEDIRTAIQERNEDWNRLQKAESRLIVLEELLERFALLKRYYEADLARLAFIAEGQHYFSQLDTANCPLCGKPLDEHERQQVCDPKSEQLADIEAACRKEVEKIRRQLLDLESTVESLVEEAVGHRQSADEYRNRIKRVEARISSELEPKTNEDREQIQRLLDARRLLIDIAADQRKLDAFRLTREQLGKRPKPTRRPKKYTGDTSESKQILGEHITSILIGWNYIKEGRVTFDDNLDIVVNGRARTTHGKGVRAVLHAAFTIGLMRFCLSENLPHPGFVILDSPITTFRDAESSEGELTDEEKLKLQENFYSYLCHASNDEQIIILENIEPTLSVQNKINYIHFGGPASDGRKGFFP